MFAGMKPGLCLFPCHLLLLALSYCHCREKHWFPLHKCFFLVPGSQAPASIVMCSHVHMCACISGRTRKAVKTHQCTNMFVSYGAPKMKPETRKGYWIIIETKPMQHQCFKKNTPANTACSSSSKLFFLSALICHGSVFGLKGRPRCVHAKVFSGLQDYDLGG